MPRYTISQAAHALGISVPTLRRWERERKVPAAPRHPRTQERQYDDALLEIIRRYKDGDEPPRRKK